MDPLTLLLVLGGYAIGSVIQNLFFDQAKKEAETSKNTILGDLDAALATEKTKLGQEYDVTKKRLEETRDIVLGSQRQGFFLRGDVGGQDTAASQTIQTTENRAKEDLDLLKQKYDLGIQTLDEQTKLAKDELDWNFKQYITGITAQQTQTLIDFASTGITGLIGLGISGMKGLNFSDSSTILGNNFLSFPVAPTPASLHEQNHWNPMTGYPG